MENKFEIQIEKVKAIIKENETIDLSHAELVKLSKKALLGNKDVEALFQISSRTLYTWRRYKGLRYYTVSLTGRVYYLWPDIVAFIKKMSN